MTKIFKFLILCLYFLLAACVFSQNDDATETYTEKHYRPMHKIKSAEVFLSDKENAKYENDISKIAEKSIIIEKEENLQNKEAAHQTSAILFDNGLSSVEASYKAELSKIAEIAKQKNAKVFVYGYATGETSSADKKKADLEVAMKRAQNIADVLIKLGVQKDNIVTVSSGNLYGETRAGGNNPDRQAEIYISY